MIVHPVRYALDYYRKLNEAVKDEQRQQRKSVVTLEPGSSTIASPNSPGVGNSLQAQLEQQARVAHQVWPRLLETLLFSLYRGRRYGIYDASLKFLLAT